MDIISTDGIAAKRPSKAWYLLPIFFSIVGGLIMYYVLKDEDRMMAKKGLMLSIILTVAAAVVAVLLVVAGVMAFVFAPHTIVSSTFPHTTPA